MKRSLLCLCCIAVLMVAFEVRAATPPTQPKVLKFSSLNITGEISKPQVFYLLNRKKIQVRHRPEEKDLIKSLENTVKEEPF